MPPDYSAVRVAGRRAYELARHGKKPELRARTVTIHELTLTAWDGTDPERPTATLEIRCSAGTYIRALARDLGDRLGSGAYLVALTRTASGPSGSTRARSLDQLREAANEGRIRDLLLPSDTGLDGFPKLQLGTEELGALARGQVVKPRGGSVAGVADGLLRIVDGGGPPGRHGAPRGWPAPPGEGLRRTRRLSARVAVLPSLEALPEGRRLVVTVGVFDGVHRGHHARPPGDRERAPPSASAAPVITFEPHPGGGPARRSAAAPDRPARSAWSGSPPPGSSSSSCSGSTSRSRGRPPKRSSIASPTGATCEPW